MSTVQATGTAGTGTPLTADGSGGIVEVDAALSRIWDNYRLSPDTIWVSSQEALNISKKILTGSTVAAQRFVFETSQNAIGGGIMVRTYLNRFSMQGGSSLDVKVHPNMPAGTILMTTKALPYPLSGVGNVMQIRTRQDYYQIEWPLRSRKYEYGVYADEVLQHYFPPSHRHHQQYRQWLMWLRAPQGCTGLSYEGRTYHVGSDGLIDVDDRLVGLFLTQGFAPCAANEARQNAASANDMPDTTRWTGARCSRSCARRASAFVCRSRMSRCAKPRGVRLPRLSSVQSSEI